MYYINNFFILKKKNFENKNFKNDFYLIQNCIFKFYKKFKKKKIIWENFIFPVFLIFITFAIFGIIFNKIRNFIKFQIHFFFC